MVYLWSCGVLVLEVWWSSCRGVVFSVPASISGPGSDLGQGPHYKAV